jgi:hypothetical protein
MKGYLIVCESGDAPDAPWYAWNWRQGRWAWQVDGEYDHREDGFIYADRHTAVRRSKEVFGIGKRVVPVKEMHDHVKERNNR